MTIESGQLSLTCHGDRHHGVHRDDHCRGARPGPSDDSNRHDPHDDRYPARIPPRAISIGKTIEAARVAGIHFIRFMFGPLGE